MIGKIAAFRKMPVSDFKFDLNPRIKKRLEIMKENMKGGVMFIPDVGVVWVTPKPSRIISLENEKEVGEEILKVVMQKYKTNINFSELGWKLGGMGLENDGFLRTSVKGVDNNQGAVFRVDDPKCWDDIKAAESSMEKNRPKDYPWDSNVDNRDVLDCSSESGCAHIVNQILEENEAVYYSGHGSNYCILIKGEKNSNKINFCSKDVAYGRQTRLFVVSACYAGNGLAEWLVEKWVRCVIADDGELYDYNYWSPCAAWADAFWDRVTGNVDAGYRRTPHEARIETNNLFGWIPRNCNLDVERGDCNFYI
ncbi:hypothetical protein [Archaeoglobus fulgidus]|jgi:hypothetical protein|uniref:Uncharacterized protein n=3 Tax=Archaeoglobus TaxID=2233 RepID=A0A075WFK0_ARCFL|nr:hypothetical protein [Archaeoglobus fulgidus]AIG99155.1 hypothetical protein AFULGI_00024380 [Archaeoglobus fulgidus DSM 8774]KUJ92955.1 MAG: hypothetical protein XD40_1826 [Archaeoglobus fulgidus]KUK06458.1 MAG: Uncharacterized protein XD48_1331 [Archaeoglobus fulgidus]MDI3498195.1 hypothetical protein [Archaeoglobus sp.]